MIDELIKLAKKHPGFKEISDLGLRFFFETYKNSILVHRDNGEIKAFAVYQEWPDCLNFIAVVGNGNRLENVADMLKSIEYLPKKKICFFDEAKMELKVLCHQQQQQ